MELRTKVSVDVSPLKRGDLVLLTASDSLMPLQVPKAEFSGKKLSSVLVRDGDTRILCVGLGESSRVDERLLRQAVGLAVKSLLRIGAETINVAVEGYAVHAAAMVEGALMAAYKFEDFKQLKARRENYLKQLQLVVLKSDLALVKKAAHRAVILAESTNMVRRLGNLPGNVVSPEALVMASKSLAKSHPIKCTVWDENALKKEGFGGILAVGKGSQNPPRLIALEYRGGRPKEAPIVVVGKAITFDSGGISIKPSDRMDEMKFDKMGGCAVIGVMRAVAELELPLNVVGLIASAENMPSANAYRPGDLVRSYDGKVIEVLNTDAEGRIVLADALAYARLKYKPAWMVDFATLTGACVVALGGKRAGLFTQDMALRDRFVAAGERTGDRVWPLPMGEEYDEQIKSDIALVKNTGGREGGACTAASFLKAWVEDVRWAHIDIAGPAWTTSDLPYLEKGATGFGVRLLVDVLSGEKEI